MTMATKNGGGVTAPVVDLVRKGPKAKGKRKVAKGGGAGAEEEGGGEEGGLQPAVQRRNREPCNTVPLNPTRTNPPRAGATPAERERTDLYHKQHCAWEGEVKRHGKAESELRGENSELRAELVDAKLKITMLEAAAAAAAVSAAPALALAPAPAPTPTPATATATATAPALRQYNSDSG